MWFVEAGLSPHRKQLAIFTLEGAWDQLVLQKVISGGIVRGVCMLGVLAEHARKTKVNISSPGEGKNEMKEKLTFLIESHPPKACELFSLELDVNGDWDRKALCYAPLTLLLHQKGTLTWTNCY